MAVLVPKTEEQIEIVKEWGDKLNSTISVRSDSSRSRNKSLVCTYEEGLVWEPLCGCFSIGTIEVCPPSDDKQLDPGDDGGGTTDCHYEPEGCQEDPNPNDPPFGGGGSNGGDNDPCPNGFEKDALGNCILIQPNPEPCNTNNPVLDNQYIQTKLDELWKDTNYGPDSNPNPENQRKEQVAIIAPNGYGGYQFLQLNVLASACQAKFQIPANLPVGSILVHTHPYANGDLQLDCIPGQVFKYRNKPGIEDRPTLEKIGIEQGIILDAEKIIIFTPDQSETPTLIDRCGY